MLIEKIYFNDFARKSVKIIPVFSFKYIAKYIKLNISNVSITLQLLAISYAFFSMMITDFNLQSTNPCLASERGDGTSLT